MLFLDKTIELTDIDLLIYKYVSQNIDKVIYMRIRELAHETHTSTASIQRFCTKFECEGFTEFKIRLKLYLKDQREQHTPAIADPTAYINFFQRVQTPEFQQKIDEALDVIKNCELILFLGVGSSNILAEYGTLYFSSLFHMALRIEDPITYPHRYFPKDLLRKTCVVALSVSGETPEIVNYLSSTDFSNSHIISITNSEDSAVARLSEINISYYINRESVVEQDITSQIPCMFILEYMAKLLHEERLNIH